MALVRKTDPHTNHEAGGCTEASGAASSTTSWLTTRRPVPAPTDCAMADAWTGNHWTVEEVDVKGETRYVARNQRDGLIANDHRHDTREQAQRQADLLNAFWGDRAERAAK